ncbi:TetR family transcriptional regulator, partial [Streptomyces sp. FT05W]
MAVRGYPEGMTAPLSPPPGPPDPGEARTSLTLAAADGPEALRADAARN